MKNSTWLRKLLLLGVYQSVAFSLSGSDLLPYSNEVAIYKNNNFSLIKTSLYVGMGGIMGLNIGTALGVIDSSNLTLPLRLLTLPATLGSKILRRGGKKVEEEKLMKKIIKTTLNDLSDNNNCCFCSASTFSAIIDDVLFNGKRSNGILGLIETINNDPNYRVNNKLARFKLLCNGKALCFYLTNECGKEEKMGNNVHDIITCYFK
ncbi:MAG: hypothetical protein WBQ73_03715 [Candidatus Babeliales bacterium]